MDVSRVVLEQIYEEITTSVGYATTVGPIDKSKVSRRREGEATKLPSAKLARAAWRTAALLAPLSPPPPPPPPAKRVAPKVANKQDSSDARFCCFNQPGVTWSPNHPLGPCYVDDVARYDGDGLHLGGRSDACTQSWTEGLVGAKELDGREPCALPRVGDPALNTGSWTL